MKKTNYIQKQVDETLETASRIKEIKLSSQFKENVMAQLFVEKKQLFFSWFTPKLQFATLAMVIIINTLAIFYITKTNYNSNVQTFAQSFNICTEESLLN